MRSAVFRGEVTLQCLFGEQLQVGLYKEIAGLEMMVSGPW